MILNTKHYFMLNLLSPNRDPYMTISSVWVHKWVWMLANLTLVSLLFLAVSNIIFTLVRNIHVLNLLSKVCRARAYDGFSIIILSDLPRLANFRQQIAKVTRWQLQLKFLFWLSPTHLECSSCHQLSKISFQNKGKTN